MLRKKLKSLFLALIFKDSIMRLLLEGLGFRPHPDLFIRWNLAVGLRQGAGGVEL